MYWGLYWENGKENGNYCSFGFRFLGKSSGMRALVLEFRV